MQSRLERQAATLLLVGLTALLPTHSLAQVENLALHAPYEWSPAPNYPACSEAGDIRQLTDGHLVNDSRGFVASDMVGWSLPAGSRLLLTIDLGRTAEIDAILLSTRHAADAEVLPPSVVVATSDDGEHFVWAGDHDSGWFRQNPNSGSRKVELRVPVERRRRGRWVHLIFTTNEDFLFLDEIAVMGHPLGDSAGDSISARSAHPASTVLDASATFERQSSDAVARRQRRLWALRAALPGSLATPLCYPHRSIDQEESARFAHRAQQWRHEPPAQAARPGLRRVDPWQTRHRWSAPGVEVQDTLRVCSGSWSAIAVDVWSVDETLVHCRVTAQPPNLTTTLRSAVGVEARNETWHDDALPRLIEPLGLQAGQCRQLWIDVDATATPPGVLSLQLSCNQSTLRIPVRVHAAVPSEPAALTTLNWTYATTREAVRDRALEAIRDNRASLINSWMMDRSAVPWPRRAAIDARGHRSEALDFSACDAQLQQYADTGNSRQFGWYWNFWIDHRDPSGGQFAHPYFSRPWKQAVSQWLREWTEHLGSNGYTREHIFMNPVDERGNKRVRDLYRYLKSIAPRMRLAVTLSRGQSQREIRDLVRWLDIGILNREIVRDSRGFIERMHRKGSEVWIYAVLDKASSPMESYRLLAWEAWALGLQGCAFWSYANVAGDSWDDFDGDHRDFSVVYVNRDPATSDAEPFVPSRRWRAFRMGMQDVQRFAAMEATFPHLRQEVDTAIQQPERRAALLRRSFSQ